MNYKKQSTRIADVDLDSKFAKYDLQVHPRNSGTVRVRISGSETAVRIDELRHALDRAEGRVPN